MSNQCKCGSLDFFMNKQGNNTGLYCSMCGKWQKWMSKDDIRIFEHNHIPKKKKETKQTNADRIRSMDDVELAEFLESFKVCTNCEYKEKTIGLCTFDNICTHGFATAMALKWLQSEADTKGE